ncbi:MAG: 4-(cytidine 5'-diphospho)-2-C-methyl-D-erythritol kinase [Trueperaceae bacterium]|nr:4-(cytidine 5'-diphospho)-2-C-methyl-D-erythritol kinase [Trueperaceae bacterium]
MKLKAYAKLNLGLAVTGKRSDGFHELDTLFARIALHDVLELQPKPQGITVSIEGADLPVDRGNLVYRAADLYLQEAKCKEGISIHLRKQIPIAAGLGGGSSDAAAVLRGMAQLYPADLDLQSLAERLGSDVPFFVHDHALAHGWGRGEQLKAIQPLKRELLLVNPGIHVSAKEAYVALKAFAQPLDLPQILEALKNQTEPPYSNSLAAGVLGLYPEIARVLDVLRQAGLQGVLMSGSGSTCFGFARDGEEAKASARFIQQAQPQWWVQVSHLY